MLLSKSRRSSLPVDVFLKPKEAKTLFPTDILFQTVYWSQVKSRLGWKALAFDFSASSVRGDVLVLTRTFGKGITAAYVPQGPESSPVAGKKCMVKMRAFRGWIVYN